MRDGRSKKAQVVRDSAMADGRGWWDWDWDVDYPLVNVYITMENHHAING